jgi:HEAT repeat protein
MLLSVETVSCRVLVILGLALASLPLSRSYAASASETDDLKRTLEDQTLIDAARQDAAERLSKSGAAGVTILMTELKSPEAATRRIAIRAMGVARLTNAVDRLIARMQETSQLQDNDKNVELGEIITALGKIGDRRAAQAIFALQHDFFGNQSMYGYNTGITDLSTNAANVLVQLSGADKTVQYFIGELDSEKSPRRQRALVVLGALGGKQSIGAIILRLGDTDQQVRSAAVTALVDLKGESYYELKRFVEAMERQGGFAHMNEAKQALRQVEEAKKKQELTTGW